ncbi:MAG: CYTH domain-containing protein [Oscillospiraceae bacterium]|nr:CYTH domain-containing protein [Oscillospiraceae bacterium]
MGIEFELKYRADAGAQRALLAHVGADARVIAMETTYYDTPDRLLSARKITLRRRMENERSVCTVKTPAGNGDRGEWEFLSPDITAAVPELCKLGAPEYLILFCAQGLEPVCGARFTRRAVDIVTADFAAELALDSGLLLGGGREIPLCEVELELKSGSRAAMIAYMEDLAGRFGLVPEKKSKFRRAMDLAEGV